MEPENSHLKAALIARETARIEHRTARIGLLDALVRLVAAFVPVAGVIGAVILT